MANIKLETILVVVWVVALNWIASPADASRILMALPSHSRSHVIVARALLEGLVERGHQVIITHTFSVHLLGMGSDNSVSDHLTLIHTHSPTIFRAGDIY